MGPVNSVAVGDSPPDVRMWTNNPLLLKRVERLFPKTNMLEAASVILGEQLVHLILGDLYAGNLSGEPVAILKGDKLPPGLVLIGNQTYEEVAGDQISLPPYIWENKGSSARSQS